MSHRANGGPSPRRFRRNRPTSSHDSNPALSFPPARASVPALSTLLSRITVEPGKCGGRPCIRGFRLRVKDVLELLAHDATWDEILKDYPFLEADDIRACLEFAASQNDRVILRAS